MGLWDDVRADLLEANEKASEHAGVFGTELHLPVAHGGHGHALDVAVRFVLVGNFYDNVFFQNDKHPFAKVGMRRVNLSAPIFLKRAGSAGLAARHRAGRCVPKAWDTC